MPRGWMRAPWPEIAVRRWPCPGSMLSSWTCVVSGRLGQARRPMTCFPFSMRERQTAYCWPFMKVAVPSTGSRVQTRWGFFSIGCAPRSISSSISSFVVGVWRWASLCGSSRCVFVARSQVRLKRAAFSRRAVLSSSPIIESEGNALWIAAMIEAWAAKSAIVTGVSSLLSRWPLSTADKSFFVRRAARWTARLPIRSSLL